MRGLIQAGLRQPVLVNLAFVGLVIYGALVALPQIPVDRYPNFDFDEVTITTQWPGAAAGDVERLVTERIEDAVREMRSIESVTGKSMAGQSQVFVNFVDDTDYEDLYDDLRTRVLAIQNLLPVRNGEPLSPAFELQQTDTWLPVLFTALIAADPERPVSNRDLTLAAEDLRTRIEAIDGVKRVELMGDDPEQIVLALDPTRLERHGLTVLEVRDALRSTGGNVPAGIIDTAVGEHHIRLEGIFHDREGLLAVPVRADVGGRVVRVADLVDPAATGARRVDGAMLLSVDGRPTVLGKVLKERTANAASISAAVRGETEEFLADPARSAIDVRYTVDSSVRIADSLSVLTWSLTQGIVLVVAVLLLFLTWRHAVLTSLGIAVSFLGTVTAFYLTGRSLNELSLLGFVLVVGIVVDDAIVVLENIQRHRERGKNLRQAVLDGTSEVFWPVVAATLTTCASFLPLLLMTGVMGQFFAVIPYAVVTALVISLVECLLVLPLHVEEADRLLGPDRLTHHHPEGDQVEAYTRRPGLAGFAARVYDRLLNWNLDHPWRAMGMVLALFLMAASLLAQSVYGPRFGMRPLLKLEFFPDDTSIANVFVRMPSGTALAETEATVLAIARHVESGGPGRSESVTGYAGFSVDSTYKPAWSRQDGFLAIEFPPAAERDFDDAGAEIERLRRDLEDTFERDGVELRVEAQQDGPPTGQPLTVRVSGLDDAAVARAADDLLAWLRDQTATTEVLAGLENLSHDNDRFHQVVAFEPDRTRIAQLGLREGEVRELIAGAFDGIYVGEFRRLDDDIPIRLRLSRDSVPDPLAALDVPVVRRPDGGVVRVRDLGYVETRTEPALLKRRNYARTISVTGDFAEGSKLNTTIVNDAIEAWFAAHRGDYPGVAIAFGGEAEETTKSYASLITAFGVAVFAIYLILATQFRSYLQPVIILSNVVFSFIGVVLTLGVFGALAALLPPGWVRPERAMFTVQSFIAIVALTGLVVNDAIVLVDFINRRLREGLTLRHAVLIAGHQRVRPILMTTISTVAGLTAMAIGIPRFSVTWGPMATCFVAGVAMSTILTLLIVPVLYERVERLRRALAPDPARDDRRRALATDGLSPPANPEPI